MTGESAVCGACGALVQSGDAYCPRCEQLSNAARYEIWQQHYGSVSEGARSPVAPGDQAAGRTASTPRPMATSASHASATPQAPLSGVPHNYLIAGGLILFLLMSILMMIGTTSLVLFVIYGALGIAGAWIAQTGFRQRDRR